MKKITINLSFIILLLALFSQTVAAQKCLRNIYENTGLVQSNNKFETMLRTPSQKLEIFVTKTSGNSSAKITISRKKCQSCVVETKEIIFKSNEDNGTKSILLEKAKDHKVNVTIEMTKTDGQTDDSFGFKLEAKARLQSLVAANDSPHQVVKSTTESLDPNENRSLTNFILPSCTGKVYCTIASFPGNAGMKVIVSEEVGVNKKGGINWKHIETMVLEPSFAKVEKVYLSDKRLKIQTLYIDNKSTAPYCNYVIMAEASKYKTVGLHKKNGVEIKGQ